MSRFIFSGREVVTEVDDNYGLKAAIIRGHEILAQKDSKDSSYYYFNNAHGDVTALLDGRGEIVNRYKYDAFGNTIEAVEKVHNRFRYAGEQFDPVTGQYYLRARFYNPVIGRFTQEDTYRGDGLNLYAYVGNNPVNYYDPSGYNGCGVNKTNPYDGDLSSRGYRPKPGERSMTREQWKVQNSEMRARNNFSRKAQWKNTSNHGSELTYHAYNRHPSLATNDQGFIDPALYDSKARANIRNMESEIHDIGGGRYAAFNPNSGEFTVFSWQGGGGLPAGTPTIHSYYIPLRNYMQTGVSFNSNGIVNMRDII